MWSRYFNVGRLFKPLPRSFRWQTPICVRLGWRALKIISNKSINGRHQYILHWLKNSWQPYFLLLPLKTINRVGVTSHCTMGILMQFSQHRPPGHVTTHWFPSPVQAHKKQRKLPAPYAGIILIGSKGLSQPELPRRWQKARVQAQTDTLGAMLF